MSEVWGTLAVNDHMQADALVRDVLLFDRLVIPYPATEEERERWEAPNPNDPKETWAPGLLDEVLAILGTQRNPAGGESPLAWVTDWSEQRWQAAKTRREIAEAIGTVDAFQTTRYVIAMGEQLPGVVETVAAYPSAQTYQADAAPDIEPPDEIDGAAALLQLTVPLLIPDGVDGDPLGALSAAARLSRTPEFRHQRDEFYRFLRSYLEPFQRTGHTLDQLRTDLPTLDLARERLRQMHIEQQRILEQAGAAAGWGRVETVAVVGAAAAAVVASVIAIPAVAAAIGISATAAAATGSTFGATGSVAGIAGWIAAKRTRPPTRPLDGSSMFATAAEQLDRFAASSLSSPIFSGNPLYRLLSPIVAGSTDRRH